MLILNDDPLTKSFHIHIYYDLNTKDTANSLRNVFVAYKKRMHLNDTHLDIGRMHDLPIGPHTKPMFRLVIGWTIFRTIVNYLMLNRKSLTVLVHPETGNDLLDHTEHALWLGVPLSLDLSKL